jgi:hypothetical protein
MGRKRAANASVNAEAKPNELVIFPGVNLGMLREVIQDNKAKKAAAKRPDQP